MSQPHMAMANMGGPVGGVPGAQPMNAGTPTNNFTPDQVAKRLNTAIYEYLLCQKEYDVARALFNSQLLPIETADHIKQSPSQRGNQANGVENGMDVDNKEHAGVRDRPPGLPAPFALHNEDSSFLSDWWFQFWELYQGNRQKGRSNTLTFVGQQRQAQKQRQSMINGMDPNMQNMRNLGMMNNDLRYAAMQNAKMGPGNLARMGKPQNVNQANPMQGNPMERQGSQMNMSDPRSGGSPHSGDAPSPKRQRTDGNMSQINQGRPGQPGPMQGNQVGFPSNTPPSSDMRNLLLSRGLASENIKNVSPDQLQRLSAQPISQQTKSVEVYSAAIQQQMQAALQKTGSNANKGIPPNNAVGPPGAQSSPMSQQGMEAPAGEFYSNGRIGMQPNGAASAGQQSGQQNGNHALQDYQMQLMLLEQQNKKRLLMARQEQDNMTHPGGVPGPNGGRGSPTPVMMDPNTNPAMRAQMMMGQNGQPMMRPPSSHPMNQQIMQQQAEMMRQNGGQMMPNGNWPGPQPPQGMMPGQQPGQPPNMGPRAGNMPPPPAPAPGNNGTQPSSPAQPLAPPTPNASNKAKPGAKKDNKSNKAASKKGGAAAVANDDNAPPTPTPPPPVTPSTAQSFGQHKNLQMANGQPHPGQNNQNSQAGAVQTPQPDMSVAPFGDLGTDQFTNMDFAEIGSGDVLETFDFDSFLNNDDQNLGFDANFAFGDASIETDGIGN